jgi:hypothetical protein
MLEVVATWELDAELDQLDRYFRRHPAVDAVRAGGAQVLLGGRGAGKTALARHLVATSDPVFPAARIGLRDAFMAAVRRLKHLEPKEGEATARYLVLLGAFQALIAENLLQGSDIRELARGFAARLDPRLEDALPLAFNRSLVFEIFGAPGAAREARNSPAQAVAMVEARIVKALEGRKALVLFDEAAERVADAGAMDALRDDALIILLAAADRLSQSPAGAVIAPVLMARPELFERLPEDARYPWRDRTSDLAWTRERLLDLCGFRVARAADARVGESEAQPGQALKRMFASARAVMDAERTPKAAGWWNYVWRRCRARPRDAVHFLRAAARAANYAGRSDVDAAALAEAERQQSAYLRRELADELRADIADIDEVLDGLVELDRREMSAHDLVAALENVLARLEGAEAISGARRVIERLFAVSAVGLVAHEGKRRREVFRFLDPDLELDYSAAVVFHPGLARAMELAG